MLVFISCAKTMAARCSVVVPEVTVPKFETEAVRNALEMSQYSVSELERLLRVNTKIAAENRLRFHDFCSEENRSKIGRCQPFAPTRELFLNAFFRKIFQRRIFVMRKNICVSLLFFMGCFARWTVSNPIVWKEMSVCPKKVEYPCLIIGSLC